MFSEEVIFSLLKKQSAFFLSLPHNILEEIINSHYQELSRIYESNKLFYKNVFKNNRFLLANLLVDSYYNSSPPLISEVRKEFSKLNLLSENTITAFLAFFRITNRIEYLPFDGDGRTISYSISPKLKFETYGLIKTMSTPLKLIYGGGLSVFNLGQDDFLCFFLERYKPIMAHKLFLFSMIPNINIFISKDAGHMILMSLYCNLIKRDNSYLLAMSVSQIASACGVSRNHVSRILKESKVLGCYKVGNGDVYFTKTFVNFVENYMAHYFSMVCLGLGII